MRKAREQTNTSEYLCPAGFVKTHIKSRAIYLREDVSIQQLDLLLTGEAEVLKETPKSQVRTMGHWIIKSRTTGFLRALCSPSTNKIRHHSAWEASHFLRSKGVRVPEPLGYIEQGRAGIITKSWHIFQNLQQYKDVEMYVSTLIGKGADGVVLAAFLTHLAAAVNGINECGAYHSDLSGKNIFTRDGVRFYFIDLDAVQIDVPYDEEKRLKNHVQLYDSFCDAISDTLLVPFIESLLPESIDLRIWMPEVRKAQEKRRAKVESYWAKHGQPEHINPLRAFRTLS